MRSTIKTALALIPALCTMVFAAPTYNTTCATSNDCTFSFTGATGAAADVNLAASAEFIYNSGNGTLTVKVTNDGSNSGTNKYSNADMIGSIYFGTSSLGSITEGTATASEIATKAGVQTTACGSSKTDISCAFVFDDSTTDAGFARTANSVTLLNGISSIGYGIFTNKSNFTPSAGGAIGGVAGGLIAPSDLAGKANNGLKDPVVLDEATFVLNVGSNFNLESEIEAVGFQYGSSFDEPYLLDTMPPPGNNNTLPEPSFIGLIGLGVVGMFLTARRRLRKQA